MALYDPSLRELTVKIVYCGPGLSGKTSNLNFLFENLEEGSRGRLISVPSDADRTLFFDFLPLEIGKVKEVKVRLQLYTVPGQVFYEETRRKVVRGADGVVFVADSQRSMAEANLQSRRQLEEHLTSHGLDPAEVPCVLQYNKRDLKDLLSLEEMDRDLNPDNRPFFEAVANEGVGVEDTFKAVCALVLRRLFSRPMDAYVREPAPAAEMLFPDSPELLAEADATDPFALALHSPERAEDSAEILFVDEKGEPPALADGGWADLPPAGEAVELEEVLEPPTQVPPVPQMPPPGSAPTRLGVGEPLELSLEIGGKPYVLRLVLEPKHRS
jgi:hypothetical protein